MLPILDDGSLQGLFLKEEGGAVRVKDTGETGIFSHAKINKRDVIVTINGHEIRTINDCERALKKVIKDIVPVLTYNVFRKARSTFLVSSTSNSAEKSDSIHSWRSITDSYDVGTELGSGAFSTVVLCRNKSTGKQYAMKVVNRATLSKSLEEALRHEIAILNEMDHPNILRLFETFSTIKRHYLITELVVGGELFDRLVEKSTYTESEARDLSRTLLTALKYCHSKHVCHRDLKVSSGVMCLFLVILLSHVLSLSYGSLKTFYLKVKTMIHRSLLPTSVCHGRLPKKILWGLCVAHHVSFLPYVH